MLDWPDLEMIRFWLWSGSASGCRIGLKDSLRCQIEQ